jgi:hypothetical protein
MSAEGPQRAGDNNWNRAAWALPSKGLVLKVLVAGVILAFVLMGLIWWYMFDSLTRAADQAEAATRIDTRCDVGETPAKADEPLSEGRCIPDEFRITVTYGNTKGR